MQWIHWVFTTGGSAFLSFYTQGCACVPLDLHTQPSITVRAQGKQRAGKSVPASRPGSLPRTALRSQLPPQDTLTPHPPHCSQWSTSSLGPSSLSAAEEPHAVDRGLALGQKTEDGPPQTPRRRTRRETRLAHLTRTQNLPRTTTIDKDPRPRKRGGTRERGGPSRTKGGTQQ